MVLRYAPHPLRFLPVATQLLFGQESYFQFQQTPVALPYEAARNSNHDGEFRNVLIHKAERPHGPTHCDSDPRHDHATAANQSMLLEHHIATLFLPVFRRYRGIAHKSFDVVVSGSKDRYTRR